MIYHSTQSDDCLWYLILRGKQKSKNTRIQISSPFSMVIKIKKKLQKNIFANLIKHMNLGVEMSKT